MNPQDTAHIQVISDDPVQIYNDNGLTQAMGLSDHEAPACGCAFLGYEGEGSKKTESEKPEPR
jgi:hypothetical protein